MSSDLREMRTVSLTRWSNKARSFCRHLARVNASEPHTRSMMYPIPGSARSTTEVFDVCFQNMRTRFLVVQNRYYPCVSALAVWDRFAGSQRSISSVANCDWSVAPVPISSGRIPAAEAMSEAERRMRHHDVKMLYEKALQCDGWGDVRERPDPRTALTRPTRAPGESAVFY